MNVQFRWFILAPMIGLLGCRSGIRIEDISFSPDREHKLEVFLRHTGYDMKTRLRMLATSKDRFVRILTEKEIARASTADGIVDQWNMGICFCQVFWPSQDVAVALVKNCLGSLHWIGYDFRKQQFVSTAPYRDGMAAAITQKYKTDPLIEELWPKSFKSFRDFRDPIAGVKDRDVGTRYRRSPLATDWVPE